MARSTSIKSMEHPSPFTFQKSPRKSQKGFLLLFFFTIMVCLNPPLSQSPRLYWYGSPLPFLDNLAPPYTCQCFDGQIKKAENLLKAYTMDPACVPPLVQQMQSSLHEQARQLAALLLKKRLMFHWKSFNDQQKVKEWIDK